MLAGERRERSLPTPHPKGLKKAPLGEVQRSVTHASRSRSVATPAGRQGVPPPVPALRRTSPPKPGAGHHAAMTLRTRVKPSVCALYSAAWHPMPAWVVLLSSPGNSGRSITLPPLPDPVETIRAPSSLSPTTHANPRSANRRHKKPRSALGTAGLCLVFGVDAVTCHTLESLPMTTPTVVE